MKLCFLAGADSVHSYKWVKYFAERGHQVSWLTLPQNQFGGIKNTEIRVLKSFGIKQLNVVFNALTVKDTIAGIAPDVFHAHYAGVNGILGALSGFHPFVLTVWGSDILINAQIGIFKPVIKKVLAKADLVTCDAEMMKEELIKLGVPESKIRIIYFGVDTEKFTPGPKDEKIIKELNLKNYLSVISLRNFEPIYSLETLIKAIPLVLTEVSNAKFIIAGKGSQEKKLKALAESFGCSKNIEFVGWIPQDELPRYLRTADICVSTSLSDSTSVSLLEAMASGLIPVVTEVGENRQILADGRNGLLVPVRDYLRLAEKIIFSLKDDRSRAKLKDTNRKMIEEKYNFRKEMEKMQKIYSQLTLKY
jgi:glycosyltransferase involved in cell wall biosynthesis